MGLFSMYFTGSPKPEPASLVVGPDCDQDLSITKPEGLEVLNQIRVVHGKLSVLGVHRRVVLQNLMVDGDISVNWLSMAATKYFA